MRRKIRVVYGRGVPTIDRILVRNGRFERSETSNNGDGTVLALGLEDLVGDKHTKAVRDVHHRLLLADSEVLDWIWRQITE